MASESVFEEIQFSEANNVLLLSLMEETDQDDDVQYYGDDRLVSMIQSLEAEISHPLLDQSYNMGHVDGQDRSTSVSDGYSWVDMEVVSTSAFEEMNGWSPSGNEMEAIAMDQYGVGNYSDYSQFYYAVLLEQLEPTNVLFSSQ